MKSKILSSLFLLATLGIIFTTLKSDKTGNTGSSGTGCSCHSASANTATTVVFNNVPTTATPGQMIHASFVVSNSVLTSYGFNIAATGGTLATNGTANTKLSGGQLTHSAVMSQGTIDFMWTAPSTPGTYILKGVGNAVNANNAISGDQWNNTTATIVVDFPASVTELAKDALQCYPNPASNFITIAGLENASNIVVYNLFGQIVNPSYSIQNGVATVRTENLTTGVYYVRATVNNKTALGTFVKQ